MDVTRNSKLEEEILLNAEDIDALWEFNASVPEAFEQCIHEIIASNVVSYPEKLAVDAWDGKLSYHELDQLSTRLAEQLVGFGVGPEDIVPLCFEKSMWTVVAIMGVLKAGGAFALLDVSQPENRLREIIQQCRSKVVCTSVASQGLCTGTPTPAHMVGPELIMVEQPADAAFVPPEYDPLRSMYVCFTSGSTGRPKGIVMTHTAFCSAQQHQSEAFCFNPEARVFDFASYAFDVSVYNVMMTLSAGACLVIPSEEQRKGSLNQTLRETKATMVALTPSTSRLLVPTELPHLQTLILSGEAVSADDLRRLSHGSFRVLHAYGPAECTPMSTLKANPTTPDISTSMGKGIGALTWIVDPHDHSKLVPRGMSGELLLEGPILARGYLDEPEKTAAVFVKDPPWLLEGSSRHPGRCGRLYKTGDLVRADDEGNLTFIGRKDAQVKIRGQRLELGEVEHHVQRAMSSVGSVVAEVIELGGDKDRAMLAIFFTGDQGFHGAKELGEGMDLVRLNEDAQSMLVQSLPAFMVPSLYFRVPTIPLSTTGKTDRKRLRAVGSMLSAQLLMELRSSAKGHSSRPRTEAEARLGKLWASVLEVDEEGISIEDDFISIGGDSIRAMRLVAAARKAGFNLSVSDVFKSPTLSQQAALQASSVLTNESSVEPFSLLAAENLSTLHQELASLCSVTDKLLIQDAYPCTPLQEGMFSLGTKRTGDYVLQAVLELHHDVELQSFKAAWETAFQAAAIFRTRIVQHNNFGLVQVVCKESIDWKYAQDLDEYLQQDKAATMGLGDGLVRFALIGDDAQQPHKLVWTMHHALYDGWSLQLMINLVKDALRGSLAPESVKDWPEFGVFVKYTQERDVDDTKDFWQSYLADAEYSTFPSLPMTLTEPVANASLDLMLPSATQPGITLSTMVRGALALLISRYTGSGDVVFGAITSGRNASVVGLESIVGPTIAAVPIRAQIHKDQSIIEYLQELQQDAIEMTAYEQVGLQKLARFSDEGRNACGFQTLLVVQPQEDEIESDQVLGSWETSPTQQGFTTYAITLECFLGKKGMKARASFDTRVVDTWRMGKMLEQLSVILDKLALSSPDLSVADIEALSKQDKTVLGQWNGGESQTEVVNDFVHHVIQRHAVDRPDAPAINSWDGQLTHRQLDELAARLSHNLTAAGLGPDIIVPLCFEKSMFTVIAILGVLKAGGAFVLLDPGLPDSRLRKLCAQVHARTAVASPSCRSRLSDIVPEVIVLDSDYLDSLEGLEETEQVTDSLQPSNAAYVIFTSGSTGEPKGVIIEHRSYCSAIMSHREMNMSSDMRALQFGSYNFAGSIIEMLMTLIHGGCICIPSEEERGSGLAKAIRKLDANWTFLTSTVLANLSPEDVPCLKTICVGGEPIKSAQIKQWSAKVHLRQTYGSAEQSGVISSARLTEASSVNDVGKPNRERVWLVDATDTDRLAPIGIPGEIIVEGPVVGREYIGQPEKSAIAFIRTPRWRAEFGLLKPASRFYKTGDLAVYKEDGTMQLLGRKDTQIKLRGQRIEVGEVEHHAKLATPDVLEVAVELTTTADSKRGPELVGFLVLRDGPQSPEEGYSDSVSMVIRRVQAKLESVLPYYMIPSLLVPIAALPLTASRKTDRMKLRQMGPSLSTQQLKALRLAAAGEKTKPQTEAEKLLVTRWSEALNMDADQIGVEDSFFRLGGDSIAAMRLVGLARKSQLKLVVADIFRNPTLAAQARVLQTMMETTTSTSAQSESIAPFSLLDINHGVSSLREELGDICDIDASSVEDAYPTTPLQEGLLSLTAKRSGDYIMQAVLDISHDVHLRSLIAAWEDTVQSIPILRTRVVQHSRLGLLQVVCSDGIQWRRATSLDAYLASDSSEPMDFGMNLSRFALIGDGDNDVDKARFLVWTAHHALFDGWSLPLILDTVKNLYTDNQIPVSTVGFNYFVKHLVEGQSTDNSMEFWQSYLARRDYAPFPGLPSSVQEPAADAQMVTDMGFLPKLEDTTVPILLRGALGVLISQYAGSSDVIMGATVSGRNAPVEAIEDIIGPTIATVPVRVQVQEEQSVKKYLEILHQEATEMIAHEQTGLQRIAKINDESRIACNFQTLLVIHTQEEEFKGHDELGTWKTSSTQQAFTTYAVTLECFLNGGSIRVKASYDTEVISAWKMDQMLQRLRMLLHRLASCEPKDTLRDVCAASEQDMLTITKLNDPKSAPSTSSRVHDLIASHVESRPDAPAVHAWDGNLSYQELDLLSTKLAHRLAALGVGPEIVVPICSEKSFWTVVALLGVLKAGGAFVLLDPSLPDSRIQKLCQRVGATTSIASPTCHTRLSKYTANTLVLSSEVLNGVSDAGILQPAEPSNAAYIIFTSGSTGEPKGVIIEHRSYCAAALGHGSKMNMGQDMRALQFGSYNFAGAIMEMMMTLIYGGCICIPSEEQRGAKLVETIRSLDANWAFLTSTVLAKLKPQDVPSLRTVCVGGEPIRASQIKQWAHINLRQTYGSAETAAVVSSAALNTSSVTGDVGRATAARYWIVNPNDNNQLVPVGAPGEVIIEGPMIGREYIAEEEKTRLAFIAAPSWRAAFGPCDSTSRFYRTGDLAAYGEDGAIELLGRKDMQVKLRGQRIEVGEIEYQAKQATLAVKDAAVELAPIQGSSSRSPELVGFLVIDTFNSTTSESVLIEDRGVDETTLAAIQAVQVWLEATVPYFMVPSILVPIAHLPLTVSGKTDRRRLRQMASELTADQLATLRSVLRGRKRSPRTDAETQMRDLWSLILQVETESIGIDDSFFRLGGDSIAAMKLVGEARKAGIALAVADIFRHPVLAAQASIQASGKALTLEEQTVMPFSLLGDVTQATDISRDLASICGTDPSLIDDAYPCTPLQQGLLSLTQKRTGDYMMQAVLEISNNVDVASFKAAWGEVLSAAPILRTRIVQHSRLGLVQVVCSEHIEWGHATNLEQYLDEDKAEPMGLGDKLSRFTLVNQGPNHPLVFVWTLHHALYDGWSFPLTVEMAGKAYRGDDLGKRTEFNAFVEEFMSESKQYDADKYWQSYLSNADFEPFPPVQVSAQQPHADQSVGCSFQLPTKSEVTASTMLRGALAIVLSQYGVSNDIVFGATVSGRNASIAGIETIIGPTIATVPVRVKVNKEETVCELLNKVQQDAAEMMAHEQIGLQRIAKIDESCRSACGFQTLLVVQPEEDELQSDDILGTWKTSLEQEGFGTYAIALECTIGPSEVHVRVSFDSGFVGKWQVNNLIHQLSLVFEQLSNAAPEKVVGDINPLTEEDLERIWGWNKQVPPKIQKTVHQIFSEKAALQMDAPAIVSWDGEITFGELDKLSDQLAYYLLESGSQSQAVIPLCFEKSLWTIVAILGVLKAGSAFTLLDPTQAVERREGVVQEAEANLILSSAEHAKLMSGPGRTVIPITSQSMSELPHRRETLSFLPILDTDSLAYVMFTSGSTGRPKGVLLNHHAVSTGCSSHGSRAGFDGGTRTLQFSSYAFDACIFEIITTLLFGGCVCVPHESERLADIEQNIDRMSVNTAILTPTVARLLGPASVRALRTIMLCGEKPTDKDIQRFSAVPSVFNGYGPAECTVCCSVNDAQDCQAGSCIGQAVGSSIWLTSPENHDSLVPIGAVGEIVVEGSILAQGYLNNPSKTSESFIEDPQWLVQGTKSQPGRQGRLYKTGDLARYDERGRLMFVGRRDTQVKIRGQRLELGEVEHNIRACLGPQSQVVAEAIELRDESAKVVLAAFIHEPTGEQGYASSSLQHLCGVAPGVELVRLGSAAETALALQLPTYMVPTVYFKLDHIPITASGKIDRRRLRALGAQLSAKELANFKSDVEKRAPTTEEEAVLVQIWASILGLGADDIGIDDNFVQLGGDSITAMMVVGEARKQGYELKVADVLHQPRLHQLASTSQQFVGNEGEIARAQVQGPIEQSFAQGRLWFLDQLYPNSTQYLMPYAMRLRGPLQVNALSAALCGIESRHETLRTVFASENDVNLQIVRPFQLSDLPIIDIPDEESFKDALRKEQSTPFNLTTDPGWRLTLYRLGDDHHVLSIVMHHIISDGWSASILQRELSSFYSASLRGQDPLAQISPLPIQYRDYAVWQKEQNQLDEQQRQLEYWVNQLQTSAPAEFFCDKPRPAVLSGRAEIEEIVIQGSAYSRLQEFCKEREITPFIALLSAFRATHYRLTGSKDATIGTANANRDRWQLKDMIGFFVNMQCLRITADGESFEELVQQVQETTKASLKNQDIPFEQIVSRLKRDRDMARQPLVQVVFTLHSQRDLGQFKLEGLETEQMHLALSSRFDLEFHFSQEEGSLRGEVAFSTDLYERETVRNMLELFQQILHQGLHNPTQSISLLPFATEASLSDLHDHGLLQTPRTDYARESSIVDIFRQQTAVHPNRLVAKDDSGQMTYEQLDHNSNLIARWLKSRSYEDEKLIGVYSGRTCQTIAAFLGILKANMAYVPLDTRSPVGRVETIVSAIQGQRTILLGPGIQPPPLLSEDVEFVSISDILNNDYSSEDLEFSVTSNTPSPTSLAYVMFTSGSTGKPKGVMIEHRGVVRLATQNNITQHFPPFHIMAHMGNIAFDISTWEIYATILNGGTLICIDNMTVLDNNALANTFLKEGIQSAIITPALLKHCLIESPAMISQLHVLLCGGDKADGQDLLQAQKISKATVINAYGPTENTVISTFYSVKDNDAFVDGVPIGGAISNSGAFVVDSDLGLVPVGVVGELVVTGDGLARGYTNPSLNVDRFISMEINGKTVRGYRTGDYVRYRPLDAQMEFLGRIDGQLKVRGQRIELGEIENVMQSHQSVQDAVVVAQQHGEQELQLAGFITILDKDDELESLDDVVDENAAEHIEVWETLFDSDKYTTVDDVKAESIGRDFTAWTSMYDGKLIDQVEMREWLDDTIRTMLNGGAPGNVLEVGTGTGMMLFNLVEGLESYVGLEPTEKAIRFVNYAAKMIPGLSDKIYVQKGTATDVKRLRRLNTPNLIVINSVAQYFPSQRYLYDVVKQLVRQEGARTIFFGDMRSYALYDQFKMTKALHLQGHEARKSVLRQQMKEIGDAEQELLVDPAFFTALPELMPDFVEHVEIVPKQMQATNELSCYRYAAVLYVKQPEQDREIHHIASGDWINFDHDKMNRQSLFELLQHRLPITETLAVSNIPHSKTIGERHVLEQLKCRGEEDEGGWIASTLAEAELHESLSVIDLNEIAELAGCRVDISWARQYSQRGGFDAIFHHHTPIEGTNRVLFHFPTDHSGRPTNSLCSRPLMQRMRQKTPFELLERLRSQLPSYMVPQAITVLDKMPVNENGKLDRRALAESVTTLPVLQKQNSQQQPMTSLERQLQEIWAQVLYMDPATIGLEDSFFQLGGDSIAAMKVVSQAHKFNINISVADIFRNPILCELARGEEGASRELIGAVPPFSLITNQVDQGSLREQISSLCGSDAEMVEDIYPCTPLQEGLMSLTAKRHGDYVMQAVFELSAHINIPDFKTAWEVVFATTEILRTRIVQHEVLGLTQVVLKEELPWVQHKNLEGYIASDTSQEMGLGDVLSRFAIILPENKNKPRCFVWTIHHALYDGWTIPRIMGLVGDCYNDIAIKRDPPRFSSFVKHILDVKHSDAESFWRSYLADAEFATYPQLPSASFEPAPDGEIELKIALNASSKTETTVSTMIRGALALLIHQYTRSADIIFGAVLSGRNAPVSDVDDIVGPTIATVPVRVKVDEKQSVVGYLQQLQQQATDMMDFEQTGLQRIAGVDENGRRACAFQTLVAIQPHEDDQEDAHQLGRWQDSEAHQGFSSTYALILQCFLGRDQVKIKASFDTRVLGEWQVQHMIRQFGTILNKLADAQGSQTISDIDSLSDEDKEALWNLNKTVPAGVQECVHDLVKKQSDSDPDRIAVCAWDGELTYSDLEQLASQLAHRLVQCGVTPGMIVPICFGKSKWILVSLLAVLKAGGAFSFIDPTQAADRRDYMFEEVDAKIVLTSPHYVDVFANSGRTVIPVCSGSISSFSHTDDDALPCVMSDSSAYVMFTSGSTGRPKGVLISHLAASTSCVYNGRKMGFSKDTRALQFSAFTFDACILEMVTTLVYGGCVCVPHEDDRLTNIEATIDTMQVNLSFLTPTVARLIDPQNVPTLETLIMGGEKVTLEGMQRWPARRVLDGYGPTETTIICCVGEPSMKETESASIGRSPTGALWIVSSDNHDRLMPVGMVGELLLEGSTLAQGYLNNPEQTALSFIDSPAWLAEGYGDIPGRTGRLYKTGDLARYNVDGTVTYCGRKDTQVKIRGQRLELSEVEYQVRECVPSITQAVAEVAEVEGTPVLSVFFASQRGTGGMISSNSAWSGSEFAGDVELVCPPPEAETKLSLRLPAYMIPSVYFRVRELPFTSAGKVDRRKLRLITSSLSLQNLAELRTKAKEHKRPPQTKTQERMRDLWSQVLGIAADIIGLDDSFSGLGGDSIDAMKLVAMGRKVGIPINVMDIFKHGSLASLAEAKDQSAQKSLVRISYEPYSLLSNDCRDDIMSAVRAQMGSRQIVDVSPVTGFQRHVIDMSLLWPRQALNYLYIDFGLDLNLDQLKSSCRSLMNRFSLLRSAFVQAQDTWFQVSLKDVALPFKVLAANEDLLSVSYDICLEDTGTGFKSGAVPTYFWLVQNETQGSRLIVRLSHAQYDGVSLPVLLGSLFDSYEGRTLKPVTPYAEFLSFKQSQRSASYAYWDKLLKGSKMTEISQLLLPDTRRPSAFEVASHRILFEDTVSIPQLPAKVTLASAISSAWAFVLSELTGSRDIVYGSLVTGRGVNMPDIENVVGPCVNMVPVRARLSPQQTAHSLFLLIQEQNLVAQEHAVGLQDIQKNVGWAVGSDFESVVQHQGVDETPGFQLSDGSVKVGWFDSPYYFPPRLLVMSYPMAGGVRIKLHANSHIVSVDMAETLLSSLCKALKMLIASHDKPLSYSKLAGHGM